MSIYGHYNFPYILGYINYRITRKSRQRTNQFNHPDIRRNRLTNPKKFQDSLTRNDSPWIRKKPNPMDLDLDQSIGYPISIHPLGTLALDFRYANRPSSRGCSVAVLAQYVPQLKAQVEINSLLRIMQNFYC
jgi:hypothetical protein